MRHLLYLFNVLLFSSSALGQDFRIITEEYPPFNYLENGELKGLSADIVTAVFREAGLAPVRIEVLPWARAYQYALEKKNIFIFGMLRTPEREALFKWIGPITTTKISLFKLRSRGDIRVTTLKDAVHYSIGAAYSDAKSQFLRANGFTRTQHVPNDRQNFLKLIYGRIDLGIFDDATLMYHLKKENIDKSEVAMVFTIEQLSVDVYLALSRTSDDRLARKAAEGVATIRRKGIYYRIHQGYRF